MNQPPLHHSVLEDVLVEASRVVELRIAQFRALLVVFLLVFDIQTAFWVSVEGPTNFLYVALAAATFALGFSAYVIWSHYRGRQLPVTPLSIVSIGVDATLMALPVNLFFLLSNGQGETLTGPLLNQPTVFAMYLLLIASGLRFREAARFGMAVNSCVLLALMAMEAVKARLPDGMDPVALLAIRQHVILLIGSLLLAWFISVHTRTTTLKAAETALQATVDALTGVYNRHHLRQQLELLSRGGAESARLHLIMTDVDHFKAINDELGHPAGDRVLTEVARRLQAVLRSHDLLARYGGEEFCVLLREVDDHQAKEVAERLRKSVCKSPMEGRDVSVSVGLSRLAAGESIPALLERADQALYKAKEAGRNQVVTIWPEARESGDGLRKAGL